MRKTKNVSSTEKKSEIRRETRTYDDILYFSALTNLVQYQIMRQCVLTGKWCLYMYGGFKGKPSQMKRQKSTERNGSKTNLESWRLVRSVAIARKTISLDRERPGDIIRYDNKQKKWTRIGVRRRDHGVFVWFATSSPSSHNARIIITTDTNEDIPRPILSLWTILTSRFPHMDILK